MLVSVSEAECNCSDKAVPCYKKNFYYTNFVRQKKQIIKKVVSSHCGRLRFVEFVGLSQSVIIKPF